MTPRDDTSLDAERLLRSAQEGDREAFAVLVRRHARLVFALARAHAPDADTAEDIGQEALIRCWTTIRQCRDPARFRGWLRSIVRTVADRHRTRSTRRRGLREARAGELPRPPRSPPADRSLEVDELRRRLERALQSLTPLQREVLMLHDMEGMMHDEVASLLELAPATSRRHLSDARARMRRALDAQGGG